MTGNSAFSSKFTCLLLLFLFLGLIPVVTFSQAEMTVDEQYTKARQIAFEEKNYDKARKIAYQALQQAPDYHEIRVFVAKLYAWEENFSKARKELHQVLDEVPHKRLALSAIIDIERWSNHSQRALEWTNKALSHYPDDEKFLLTKASILQQMGEYKTAEKVYRRILEIYPSQKVRGALKKLRLQQMKYQATLSYRHDRFDKIFTPWQFWEFKLKRQTTFGPVIGRMQYANRFSRNGVQFNLDAYPSLMKGLYAYISGGYSESPIYPRYRFGLSLYKSLPRALEVAGGLRYLDFSTSRITIYTFSLSKYWKNYLFTASTYITPNTTGTSKSVTLLARRYFGDDQTYLGITGGLGSASADIQFAEDLHRQNSWSVDITGELPLSNRINIGGKIDFDSEQFENFNRNRYSFKVLLSYRF